MEFNWEEFISNDKIAVHCETEEQTREVVKRMGFRNLCVSENAIS